MDQGHQQDHGARWWITGVQDHLGPLKNIFLMEAGNQVLPWSGLRDAKSKREEESGMGEDCAPRDLVL